MVNGAPMDFHRASAVLSWTSMALSGSSVFHSSSMVLSDSSVFHSSCMVLPWHPYGVFLTLSWHFIDSHGVSTTRPWYFHGLPWRFHVRSWASMMILWFFRIAFMNFHGASKVLPWCFYRPRWSFHGFNCLPWCFHGTSMIFIGAFMAIAWYFH